MTTYYLRSFQGIEMLQLAFFSGRGCKATFAQSLKQVVSIISERPGDSKD